MFRMQSKDSLTALVKVPYDHPVLEMKAQHWKKRYLIDEATFKNKCAVSPYSLPSNMKLSTVSTTYSINKLQVSPVSRGWECWLVDVESTTESIEVPLSYLSHIEASTIWWQDKVLPSATFLPQTWNTLATI